MEKLKNILGYILSLGLIVVTVYLIKISYHNLPMFNENVSHDLYSESVRERSIGELQDNRFPRDSISEAKPEPGTVKTLPEEETDSTMDTIAGKDKTSDRMTGHYDFGDDISDQSGVAPAEDEDQKINLDFPQNFNPNVYFTRVAKYAIPRVVKIINERGKGSGFWNPFGDDDSDEDFFSGIGSGAIISPDGYIVTNNHVVDKADKLRVTLSDGEEYEAEIVGQDPLTDIALIKIDAGRKLPYFKFYNGDSIQIGEWVLAVGSPLNLVSSVTAGIVSAVGRNIRIIQSSYGIESFIQTDAVINPGNSGGPLLNIHGEILGINTAIASRTGFYQSFGFAIPVDLILRVVTDLKKYGRVKRGYMGVSLLPLTFETAKEKGMPKPVGVLVGDVQDNMPAKKAGMKKGDIILKIDNQWVHAPNEVQAKIARYYPGDIVKVTVFRDGREHELKIKLKEIKVSAIAQRPPVREEPAELSIDQLNIKIRNLKREEYRSFRSGYGVIIENSGNDSLPEGALVLEINGHKVFNVENFSKLLEAFSDDKELKLLLKIPAENGFLEKEIAIR